jgi:hypothetical protein
LEDGAFTRCIDVNKIDLQPGHYFGFSAATGTATALPVHVLLARAEGCLLCALLLVKQASSPTTTTFTASSCAALIPRANRRTCPSYV